MPTIIIGGKNSNQEVNDMALSVPVSDFSTDGLNHCIDSRKSTWNGSETGGSMGNHTFYFSGNKNKLDIDAESKDLTLLAGAAVKANDDGFENNPYLDAVQKIADEEGAIVVAVCAEIESELSEMDDEDRVEFMADLGLEEPGLNRVINAGYSLLHLQTYFTAGVKEVRAWTVKQNATAPQAAGVIHTDFEKGFIRAEVIAYEDFIEFNGESGAKEAGKWRLEGKEYRVKDGDVVHFRFNV